MKNIILLLFIVLTSLLTACGTEEPNENSKTCIYEATFINTYPGTSVSVPTTETLPIYLESFLPHTLNVTEEITSWGEGPTTTHDTYRLELSDNAAQLSIKTSGTGIHHLNRQFTHDTYFTPGEYKDKVNPENLSYVVEHDRINVYNNGRYYTTLPNPMQYSSYGDSPWTEEYKKEDSNEVLYLSATEYSATKVYLSDDTYYFEFNPQTGLLIQEKPERFTVGILARIK